MWAENSVREKFEIMRCCRVTMEVKSAGRLQDTVQFEEAWGHHREVCEHIVRAQQNAERLECLGRLMGCGHHEVVISPCGGLIPVPGVVKCLDLGRCPFPVLLGEQHVVVGVTVEGR